MAIVTVYDLEGQPQERETVDATECVKELGWSFTPPEPEQVKEPRKRG